MSFNPDPTKQAVQIIFSRKKHQTAHPEIYFNNVEVKSVSEQKHLGLILDSKLTFASHLNEKVKKARMGLGLIKSLSNFLSVKTLDQIYKTYVRPHLDFCDIIYHIPCVTNPFDSSISLNYLMNTLERVQYQCALAVTGAWKGSSLNKIYDELGWESVTDRRYCRRMFQFYKIQNNLTPDYMKDFVPPPINHRYPTRSEHELYEINCNTDAYRASFYPDCVRCWNRIGPDVRDSPSLNSFKKRLLAGYKTNPKPIYGIIDPKGTRRLYQLRLGLSPLLDHKKKHNFIDTPSDICTNCNLPETLEHFFLFCCRYTLARNNLFSDVIPFKSDFQSLQSSDKTKFLLYGDKSLNNGINYLVLKATLTFLEDSGRFS